MSKTSKRRSREEESGLGNDFVFDFLYHDSRRIQSFLAQFEELGHSQQLRHTAAVVRAKGMRYGASAGGEIPLIAKGQTNMDRTSSTEGRESLERTYDPFWSNARSFLDFLADANLLIAQDQARIGNLVQVTGRLVIIDLLMIQRMIQVPILRELLLSREVAQAVQNIDKTDLNGDELAAKELSTRELATSAFNHHAELLSLVSSAIHCHLFGDNFAIWAILNESDLVPSASSLMLKHGVMIEGDWTIVGILDALPGRAEFYGRESRRNDTGDRFSGHLGDSDCAIHQKYFWTPRCFRWRYALVDISTGPGATRYYVASAAKSTFSQNGEVPSDGMHARAYPRANGPDASHFTNFTTLGCDACGDVGPSISPLSELAREPGKRSRSATPIVYISTGSW